MFSTFEENVRANSIVRSIDQQNQRHETTSKNSSLVTMDSVLPPRPRRLNRTNTATSSIVSPTETDSNSKLSQVTADTSVQNEYTPPLSEYTEFAHNKTPITANKSWTADHTSTSSNSSTNIPTDRLSNHSSPVQSGSFRSRDQKIDTLGFVKFMPGVGKFEDLKSEAINSWEEGVDLKLKKDSKSKKRSEWLSPGDFFSSNTDLFATNIPEEQKPDETYAEAVDRKTPAWAIEDNTSSTLYDTSYSMAHSSSSLGMWPSDTNPASNTHQMVPVVMMHSGHPYMPMPANSYANNTPATFTAPVAIPNNFDIEYALFFISIIENPKQENLIASFHKKLGYILHNKLPELTPRTFGFLLESLVIAMESKPIHDKQTVDIAHKIWEAWSPFKIHFMRFINTYAYTPSDLRLMLRFSTILVQSTLRFEQELPIMDYMGIYKRIGNIVALESKTEMFECLRILKALPLKEVTKGSLCTDDLMFTLPLIPNAKSIMFETMGKINYLKEYEKLYQTVITNQTNDSWIEDILNYLITQFLLLREEMVGPAKKAIQDLLEESSTSEMKYPVYPNTTPKAFTILLHSSGPGVVFELGNMQDTDDIMADFEEGVLVLLLPEKSESESTASKSVKDTALMGQAIRASARSNGPILRLVSIQINKNDLRKLNWDIKYTMIVFRINAASTLSTLEWLYKSCFNMEKKHFSKVLTPRILAASNNLTTGQIKAWDESVLENALAINADATPYYIVDAEIDVSCIMANSHGNYRACPGKDIWPRDPLNMQNIPTTKLPPFYCLSPSQLESVKFAMSHRIAIISGAPGTGKTFMAAKLAQLLGEVLTVGQFHQPVLVIAKSQSTLDDILSKAAATIPGIVRFGNEPFADNLMNKQITRLATISASDQNYRQHQQLERQLLRNQAKLNILLGLRAQAKDHDPSFLATTIPPQYRQMLEKDYIRTHGVESHISDVGIWTSWAHHDKRTKMFDSVTKVGYTQFKCAQWYLENEYIKRAGRGLLPIMDGHTIKNRFTNVANLSVHVTSIANASCWPFDQSASYSGAIVRDALMKEWRKTPVDRINYLSDKEKTDLIHRLVNVLVNRIDKEIQGVMQDQIQTAEAHDDNLIQKWIYMCRFKRVIGMTAANASAHRNFIASLWPRAVIVDEASEILESTLSSVILGPRTEHVVLLGISDHLTKPCVANPELVGEPHRLDTSLFERWKSTNIEKAHLEEQWRMHSEIASVIHQFDNRNNNTAPLASCDENMVDGKYPAREALYGISERALYIHYQPSAKDDVINPYYKRLLMSDVTNAQVNEARYVASLATYLSQQPYQKASIAILTLNVLQKYLIRMILKDEIPKRTCFTSNLKNIALDTVEQYAGRQNSFTIISTATPGYSCSTLDNVTQALTRAKYGLFIIGKPEQDRVHPRWKEFANYMQDRGLYGNSIRLTCHAHGDTINAGCWQDFVQMKNGGCQRPCNTLMSDSHTCKEECHFLSHAEVVCREPCNRIRPSGCTHACLKKCYECSKDRVCPPCTEKTEIVLPCGHQMQGLCHMLQGGNGQNIQCKEIVNIDLTCGHSKTIHCYRARDKKVANLKCDLKQSVTLDCGHTVTSQCGIEPICIEPCSQSLECGHKCQGICGIPHLHDRSQCIASCPKQLICGHMCAQGCANPDQHTERCVEKCNYVCSHGYKCSRECFKDCIRCISECPYRCDHYKCTKKCYEICDRPPCNEPCRIKLECGHKCAGLCGENCPPCIVCNGDLKCSITLRELSEFEKGEKAYQLPECGCVFSVESLDMYFETQVKNGQHTAIKLWQCPKCQKPTYTALRYNKYIKTEVALVNTIKVRMEKDRQQLTYHEREQIISAMNDETRHHAVYNIVGGRWFVCRNQHPYYVGDCGGATEVSKCPECDAPIGGTGHRVVESNRFYGEFDGSKKPAWPGQPE